MPVLAKVQSLNDHCRLPNAMDRPHQCLAMLSPSQGSWSTSNLGGDSTVVGDDGKGKLESGEMETWKGMESV